MASDKSSGNGSGEESRVVGDFHLRDTIAQLPQVFVMGVPDPDNVSKRSSRTFLGLRMHWMAVVDRNE